MMEKKVIYTDKGETSYYILTAIYKDMISFHVKFEGELSECEFTFPINKIQEENHELLVMLFAKGCEQGRQRGRWEKARKFRELFDAIQRETI